MVGKAASGAWKIGTSAATKVLRAALKAYYGLPWMPGGETMGQLYPRGRIWWAKYYVNGRPVRESTGCQKEQEARRVLKAREGDAAKGLPILPRADRIRYEEAAEDLREHYRTTGSRDLLEAEKRLKHLDGFFGGMSKLLRLPVIRKLKEAAPREGFFEREQFLAVRRRLPEDLQVAVGLAYALGWRMQSEVLGLERRQRDLEAGTLRLDPGTTKNDEGRVVYLPAELKAALAAQVGRVEALQRRLGRIIPWLFPHLRGAKVPNVGRRRVPVLGERRGDFRKRG